MGNGVGAISRRRVLLGGLVVSAVALAGPARVRATAAVLPGGRTPLDLLRAYVSTLVPGPGDDPRGTAGAVEAGGVESILDHAPYVVPVLAADLTGAALAAHGRPFESLDYAQREAILLEAFADGRRSPYHLIALSLGAGAFYADFHADRGTRVGGAHLGFPGPSEGYLHSYTDRTGHGQPQLEAVPP